MILLTKLYMALPGTRPVALMTPQMSTRDLACCAFFVIHHADLQLFVYVSAADICYLADRDLVVSGTPFPTFKGANYTALASPTHRRHRCKLATQRR